MSLAPVILFAYNRPEHTKQTVNSLLKNTLANITDITIYSDAPKNAADTIGVQEVREFLSSIRGFKSVEIIERQENYGLAKSIISGVTHTVETHERCIVLEDDMLTSPGFLKFMNESLDYYKSHKKVMHITGWSYPISGIQLDDSFLWRGMNCWGWATWADRWSYFAKDVSNLYEQVPWYKRRQFNIKGRRNYWSEVALNKTGRFDTWAVFWYATIYLRSGLSVNPTESLIKNIGLDGSGVHCKQGMEALEGKLSHKTDFILQSEIEENSIALNRILKFYDKKKGTLLKRVLRRMARYLTVD